MARRNAAELVAGAVVLAVAVSFLGYAVANTGRGGGDGYSLHARFDRIDGLAVGSDVRLAGVKVGSVQATGIDPKTFQALVTFSVASELKLPKDSSAQITSNGLLGGEFLAIVPGGDEATIPADGTVTITQGAVSLDELLGKFIFNVGSLTDSVQKALHQGLPAQAEPDAPK